MNGWNFPESLKPGGFVAVCPHLEPEIQKDETAMEVHWGAGGTATNDKGETASFAATATCNACTSDRIGIEFRRAKFLTDHLSFGWWEFQPTRMGRPGRPKKVA